MHACYVLALSFTRLTALRRLAVRDALAHAFVHGLERSVLTASAIGALLGVLLMGFVFPLLPWFGTQPHEVTRLFLFTTQHLGDILAGLLVVGQAGLALTWELVRARESQRFVSVSAAGIDPLNYFVLPRVWAFALLYVVVLMVFKVVTVLAGVLGTYLLNGHFLGPEIGDVLNASAPSILRGYLIAAGTGLLLGAVCCAPSLAPPGREADATPVESVFRRGLLLIVAAKLLAFVI